MASACAQRQVLGVRSAKTRIFTTRRSRRLRRGGTGLPEDQGRVSGARKRPVALHKRRLLRRAARWTRCSSRAPSARRGAARTRVPGRRLRRRGQGGGRGGNRRRAGPRRRADGVGEERQARRLQPEVMALKRRTDCACVLCLVLVVFAAQSKADLCSEHSKNSFCLRNETCSRTRRAIEQDGQ